MNKIKYDPLSKISKIRHLVKPWHNYGDDFRNQVIFLEQCIYDVLSS